MLETLAPWEQVGVGWDIKGMLVRWFCLPVCLRIGGCSQCWEASHPSGTHVVSKNAECESLREASIRDFHEANLRPRGVSERPGQGRVGRVGHIEKQPPRSSGEELAGTCVVSEAWTAERVVCVPGRTFQGAGSYDWDIYQLLDGGAH